jgi:hypothetical protein
LMMAGAAAARGIVSGVWAATNGSAPVSLMVGPRPVLPFARDIIVDAGDHYVTGTFTWLPVDVQFDAQPVPKNNQEPAVAVARGDPAVNAFLVWSRFPVWGVVRQPEGTRVTVSDLRFSALRGLPGRGRFEATATVR